MQQIHYYSEVKEPAVDWVFKFFSAAIGCTFRPITDAKSASIVYANMLVNAEQFRIPVWRGYYDSTIEHYLHPSGYWVPKDIRETEPLMDYVGQVFRLLTLMDELTSPTTARDKLGNLALGTNFPRLEFRDRPMVDEVVQIFKQKLVEHGLLQDSALLPRWPDGKRYAVLLTHDTDGPCLLEPMELAKAGLKGVGRSNGPEMQAFLEGCRRLITGGPDPYFNFAHWAAFEQSVGAKSAFYIYVRSKDVPDHIHNPLYRVNKSKTKWHILHELAERGWEIGLHASMNALQTDQYIQTEKCDLENFLDKAVVGNRCHYWHINWRNPNESFRRLAATGLIYDCSMAWRDTPGYRSGTMTPYHPYESEGGRGLKLLEIPTILMDCHFFEYQNRSDPHVWFGSLVEQVRAYSGVLNLDWHTRTWVNKFWHAGWRSFLVQEIMKLAATGEVWFTTPSKLSEYWLSREQQLEGN